MMNMMNTYGWSGAMIPFWGLHSIGALSFTIGVILLIVWAVKHLNGTQLKTWGIWLTAIGAILSLGTIGIGARMMTWNGTPGNNMMQVKYLNTTDDNGMMNEDMEKVMDHMMGDDEDDAMNMSMNDMSEMLKGKTGDDFDKAFLEGMIPHHQGAIDMAKEVLKSAKHAELRELATGIITAQQAEIDMMNKWLKDWGYAN